MTITVFPVDAVSGAPSYTGRLGRQALGVAMAKNTSRPLGGRSGVHPSTPSAFITTTSTVCTVGVHCGYLDVEASATEGGYFYSVDAAVTKSVNVADGSNPRIDLISVRIDDPASGDGTTVPVASIDYTAGVAAASPSAPATPARSIALAQILVPKVGTGSPVVTIVAPFTAAAGGIIPCRTSGEYPSSPYSGMTVYDQALKQQLVWDAATSLWLPSTGARFFDQLSQTGSWADFTSGTMTTLATCTGFAVPLWARDGSATAFVTATINQAIISATAVFAGRLGLTGPGPAPEGNYTIAGPASTSVTVMVAGTFTIPAATSNLQPVYQVQRTSGTGALRADTGKIIWSVLFER